MSRTFESVGEFLLYQTSASGQTAEKTSQGFISQDLTKVGHLSFGNIAPGLYVKNTQDFLPDSEGPLIVSAVDSLTVPSSGEKLTKVTLVGPTGGSDPYVGATGSSVPKRINVGYYSNVDQNNWRINTAPIKDIEKVCYGVTGQGIAIDYSTYKNPFDGSTYSATGGIVGGFSGTGFISRSVNDGWSQSKVDSLSSSRNIGMTFRIDYEGGDDSHLKLNMLIFRYDPTSSSYGSASPALPITIPEGTTGVQNAVSFSNSNYGYKEGQTSPQTFSSNIDYQELHLFGYKETSVRTTRETYQNSAKDLSQPIYDDRCSYGLLRTNPKLSGNVKLTVDSQENLFLNSFDANPLLSDSKYKRYTISSESSYQVDLYKFFSNTPNEPIFQTYEFDDQYQNTKREYHQQFDNFYCYGVEQLASKFYEEGFSFLAPIWLRKILPDYFVIFRVDHPASLSTYSIEGSANIFDEVFKNARIIKTYDMRAGSRLGSYLRNIVNDPRFVERPLDVSYDKDGLTTWNGISYKEATITGKSEILTDFWTVDRPIKEFESFITQGFERNGIISTNLINLEFLFDDTEAKTYSINRYVGLYVSETQLAEFEIASAVLGKIPGQTPPPKPGVDGEPYSTRPFVQKNSQGIEIPIEYYHSETYRNNDSIIPYYQGNVLGKFPLPSMVEDPLRFFYIKDREDNFKRVVGLSEVDYGFPGSTDYKRVTQLKLFDTEEDISKYGGPSQLISQSDATLLDEGDSQLIINLINQAEDSVIAEDEVLELSVIKYTEGYRSSQYYFQVLSASGDETQLVYFQDQTVSQIQSNFTQPAVGQDVTVSFTDTTNLQEGQTIYIVQMGYYKIVDIISTTQASLKNLGGNDNVAVGTTAGAGSLAGAFPTGFYNYVLSSANVSSPREKIDHLLEIDLSVGYSGFVTQYTAGETYKVVIDLPSINVEAIAAVTDFSAYTAAQFNQYKWRMIADPVGLSKGKSWSYPVEDPNGLDWISNFSNEGTAEDVAKALASCINSFPNSPAQALANSNRVILTSKLNPVDGNSIVFKRYMVDGKSMIKNLGFYEDGNVSSSNQISIEEFSPITSNETLIVDLKHGSDLYGDSFYLVKVLKTSSGNSVIVHSNISTDTTYSLLNSGAIRSYFISNDFFEKEEIPFTIDISQVSSGSYQTFVVKVSSGTITTQKFIGACVAKRKRAKILKSDGERYYQNNVVEKTATIAENSLSIIVINTTGLYVGAAVKGTGIPASAQILRIEESTNTIIISKNSTASGSYTLTFGGISRLNTSSFLQQWFQTAKKEFSRLLPWEVQGKYIYSLPYLDEPVYDDRNNVIGYTDSGSYEIVEIENSAQEFYLSKENRVVAYRMFRPTLGLLSVFPIKRFDFDFFFSDYSYSPILELFRYFFDEEVSVGDYLELPSDENYILYPQAQDPATLQNYHTSGTYELILEGFDSSVSSWTQLAELSVDTGSSEEGFMINTYTPFYRYDRYEHPQKYDDPLLTRGVGYRNFERSLITKKKTDGEIEKVDVKKFRIKFLGGTGITSLNVRKTDFSQDKDIKEFSGFLGLSDILNQNDQRVISLLKENGKYMESFARQQLLSEYDRLRENFTKEYATLSRVVPFINKWVQEGTDGRDNHYRLNTSRAFGRTNFSPDDSVDFAEPTILSHEFPYLDTVPKDYPEELLAFSRSYMFAKLSDVAANGKTWYDLLTSNNENDWFLKYFATGSPSELDYYGKVISKNREERYTFFTFSAGLTRSQSLFRGAKIQVVDIDNESPDLPEILSSNKYDGYKFAAVQRIVPYDFYKKETPLEIEVIKNEKFKTITMIITKRVQDYRLQSGLQDYTFGYAASDNLKNSGQQQKRFDSISLAGWDTENFTVSLGQFLPYESVTAGYKDQAILRPRQLFLGGGYLQEGSPKLGGYIDTAAMNTFNSSNKFLDIFLKSTDETYPFVIPDEVNTFINSYPIERNSTYPFYYDYDSIAITPSILGKEGFLDKFMTVGENSLLYYVFESTDTQYLVDSILTDKVGFSSSNLYPYYRNKKTDLEKKDGLYTAFRSNPVYPFSAIETFLINGGTKFYQNTKNLSSFANIKKWVNSDDPIIKYYEVDDGGRLSSTDYKLRFVAADSIKKTKVLNYKVDSDKPPVYSNVGVIGYDINNTNQNELVIRHRGFYEPKSIDVISFWVREDQEMTDHFDKDFLLANTRMSNDPKVSGNIKNYGINKVAEKEILKISEGTAYKSVYEFIHEIAVDRMDVQSLSSNWDAGYYRNYSDLNTYQSVDGYVETKEFKAFLGSKVMNVPGTLDVQTFNESEASSTLDAPSKSVGLVPQESGSLPVLTIDLKLKDRLLRYLLEEMTTESIAFPNNFTDEFSWLNNSLQLNLTNVELEDFKKDYLEKNIIQLYKVDRIDLYSVTKDDVPLFVSNLSEAEKIAAGYRIDQDCLVNQNSNFDFTIKKTLDTKKSTGFSIGVIFKRV
jgi:hypothetical protein